MSSVAVSGDGSFVAAGTTSGQDKRVYLFTGKGDPVGTYQTRGWVMDVALSSDGSALAAVDNVCLYYFNTGQVPPTPAPAVTVATPGATTPPATAGTEVTTLPPTPAATTPPSATVPPASPQPTKSGEIPPFSPAIAVAALGIACLWNRRTR